MSSFRLRFARCLTVPLFSLFPLISAACGHPDPSLEKNSTVTVVHNPADDLFVQQMVMHHQQALDLADLVPSRSAHPEVATFAASIRESQGREMTEMNMWVHDFGLTHESMSSMNHDDMLSSDDVSTLRGLRGLKFDRRWISLMAQHHAGAVRMARKEIEMGSNPDVKALAQSIVAAQTAEIADLGALREKLEDDQ